MFIKHQRKKIEQDTNDLYIFQFNSDFSNLKQSDPPMNPFKEFIQTNKLTMVNEFEEANFILFTDYSYIDQNINKIPFDKNKKYFIYGLYGSDQLASKSLLALHLKNNNFESSIPKTFILDQEQDIEELKTYHKEENLYMVKKNIQRQEGNLITKDFDFIINKAADEDYVVCQELLQNPYLVNGRKINLRVYMLIANYKDDTRFYIYNNGFMYYTPKMFEKNSLDKDTNITTGYIDRKVYEENPLTIQDLYEFLGEEKSKILKEELITTFKTIKTSYESLITEKNKDFPGINFNIFGVDIAPDENLKCTVLEANKGCDLGAKDARDQEVKRQLIYDMFTLMGVCKCGDKKNFIKI